MLAWASGHGVSNAQGQASWLGREQLSMLTSLPLVGQWLHGHHLV